MDENLPPVAYRTRLDEMWNQSTASVASAFFKRAIKADMTLEQLQQVLTFGDAQPHLKNMTLGEILAPAAEVRAKSARHELGPSPMQGKRHRQPRRTSEAMQTIKDAILARVQASVGGTDAKQLVMVLQKSGMTVDALLVGRLLKQLFAEGFLDCKSGKPNIWRGRTQGRRAPEPMFIRKASQII